MPSRLAIAAATLFVMHSSAVVRAEPSDKPLGILLAAGDIAKCNYDQQKKPLTDRYKQKLTADLLGREISAAAAKGIPVAVLALGDLAYDKGEEHEFACFHRSWGKYMDYLLPVPGNHEYAKFNDAWPYFAYFEGNNKKIVSKHDPKTGYYSLDFPEKATVQWHLIALNSANDGPTSAQLDWLENDLTSDKRRCVLAFAHYFRFSSGRHGHEPPRYSSKTKKGNLKKRPEPDKTMEKVFRTLHAHGASLLISGHDHHYEEFAPQDADGKAVPDGVRSFIVGTGGGPLYGEKYQKHWLNSDKSKYQAKRYGVLKLELFASQYRWGFAPVSSALTDLAAAPKLDCNTRVVPKKPS